MQQDGIFRLPAEWEPHRSTYVAWPNLATENLATEEVSPRHVLISWIFAEVIRILSAHEPVKVLCHEQSLTEILPQLFYSLGFSSDNIELSVTYHTYCWLRDGGPSGVIDKEGKLKWILWSRDKLAHGELGDTSGLPSQVAVSSGCELLPSSGLNDSLPFYMEGGAFDTDGQGTLVVTEQCLFAPHGLGRNGFSKSDYEGLFARYLGIKKVVWLVGGLSGDATNGHVDNVARFVAPGVLAVASEDDPLDDNYSVLKENIAALKSQTDATGHPLQVVKIPMPQAIYTEDTRLPASYMNFYIANGLLALPTFNDPQDSKVVKIFESLFPERQVVGVYSRQLILAGGTLHCLTQQEPWTNT